MSVDDTVVTPTLRARARCEVTVRRDVRIPTGELGVTLSADLFLPVGAGTVPCLITAVPYRRDCAAGIMYGPSMEWFAARGYAGLLVDFRGTGSSGGTHRMPFDPGEADDGVAAVRWAAEQPWCDGAVGMWGHSYGAIMAMRTAGRRPAALKAIVPMMGMLDPERDFVHPAGHRGCLGSLARWGTETLLNQLMPPLRDFGGITEQRRWWNRVRESRPWLLDLFDHEPGAHEWPPRLVDASRIDVPSFCITGWRDLFCAATIHAFEQIDAPKRLLAGPWMHTLPETSPFEPVDSRPQMLRWWDQWLRGIDSGVTREPPVTLFVQGEKPGWRQFDSWPPRPRIRRLGTDGSTRLVPGTVSPGEVLAEHVPDPTVGVLSGLWGIPTAGFGLPLDEHEDDLRCLVTISDGLGDEVLITGRPAVTVHLGPDTRLRRLVVRLVDVAPDGRSTLVCAGVTAETSGSVQVELDPTCYRFAAAHRLRVVLTDADFPRLWPADQTGLVQLTGLELALPVAAEGVETVLPELGESVPDVDSVAIGLRPRWSITRDLINDGVSVELGQELLAWTPDREHHLEIRHEMHARVRRADPGAASVRGESTATARLGSGETVLVRATIHLTRTALIATGQVDVDGATVFAQRWDACHDG